MASLGIAALLEIWEECTTSGRRTGLTWQELLESKTRGTLYVFVYVG